MKAIPVLLLIFLFAGCKNKAVKIAKDDSGYYTCSMHTHIVLHAPGKCPICGMGLVFRKISMQLGNDEIQLTNQQIKLSNISVDTIRYSVSGNRIQLTGTLNFDQAKTTAISSRVAGRIEKLYFKDEGGYVSKGDKLYDLYSEDLNNAKKEYLLILGKKSTLDNSVIDFDQLIRSARNKLLLWGMSESQVQHLTASKDVGVTTSIYSNSDGYITSLDVAEGDYVMEGGSVLHLADLSTIWVEAPVYSSELYKIEKNAVAEVQVPGADQKFINERIEFVTPEVNPGTRIDLIRISIPNRSSGLKPGMAALITISNPGYSMISLPIDAVLRDGKGATIWLKTGNNTFKYRMVDVGTDNGDRIEIKSGLTDGDVVVTTGAYLLNSEYIFKNGADPMSGMKM